MHLIVEGRKGSFEKLSSIPTVERFIEDAVSVTGLTKIMEPYVRDYSGTKPEDWGVSGLVMIAESHISIHTFPENREASIDLFSCKEFDVENTIENILKHFDFEEADYIVVERGLEFRERQSTLVGPTGTISR